MQDALSKVACEPPVVVGLPRPRHWAPWLWLFVVLAAFAAYVFAEPRRVRIYSGSKQELARLVVAKYAREAYPDWSAANPGRPCPRSLAELTPYMEKQDTLDPWGNQLAFTCGDNRIYVVSLGEDGKANTADDIWSHQ